MTPDDFTLQVNRGVDHYPGGPASGRRRPSVTFGGLRDRHRLRYQSI